MRIRTSDTFKRTFIKVFGACVFVGGCIDPRTLPLEVTVAILIGFYACGIYAYHILKDKNLNVWEERGTNEK